MLRAVPYAGKKRRHRIVFLGGNRIGLVIVTTRTLHRQPEERLSYRADDLAEFVLPRLVFHQRARPKHSVVRSGDEKTNSSSALASGPQNVASDLHPGEFVVRHVGVKRVNDPVAIRPGVAARFVVLEAVALAVARDVEPVSRPPFAVTRRGQQAIN